ncbi:ABC transporter ATP-binding protein [Candidatus Woesearchaeota archaeon]|nr:ABC transporter ATP-binding protein [Candidatus Woesearchaeota archaeon]
MVDAITIKDLKKIYPKTEALKGITFSIQEGEFFGLLGPNGAGKTTAIHILTGLANKTSGEVTLFGKDVVKDYKEARALIGLVPQEFNFDQFEKVYNILYFASGYFGIPSDLRKKRIEKVLKELGLWEKKDMKAITLSGGMKRKLMIARALVHEPKILILDEPTAGVDVETRKSIWQFIRKLNKSGVTILLTTHYLEEAEELCERIAIINHGEITTLDSKNNLLKLLEGERLCLTLKEELKIPANLKKYDVTINGKIMTIALDQKKDKWETVLADIQGLPIEKMETHKNKLEDIFIHLTNGK